MSATALATGSGAIQRAELKRSARRVMRGKGWAGKSYSKLVHAYFQSPQYAKLSPRGVKLLVDLLAQYRGTNNGDLTTAWTVMQAAGWRSKDLLQKAAHELEARGWILKTRQGLRAKGHNSPTLWALTFEGINDCRDSQGRKKLDVAADTMPKNLWKLPGYDTTPEQSGRAFRKQISRPPAGAPLPESRASVTPIRESLAREPGRK